MRRALALATVSFTAFHSGQSHALPSSELSKHSYGHLVVDGAIEGFELFRAAFGSLLPCGAYPLISARDSFFCGNETGDVHGKLVLARRGNCSFFDKAVRALEGGAAGLVIVNNQPGLLRVSAGNLTANYSRPIDIPIVMIKLASAPFLDHAFKFVDALPASLVPYREPCVPPRRPSPPSPAAAAANVTADGNAAVDGASGEASASNNNADTGSGELSPGAGANGSGGSIAEAMAAGNSNGQLPYRDDDFDRTVLAALLDERRAYAGDSLDIDVLQSSGAASHAAALANGAAAGLSEADAAAALLQMRVSETADVVLSAPGLGAQPTSDDQDDDDDDNENENDGHNEHAPAAALPSASPDELRLLQSLLASPAAEGIAAFFGGPMLRPAVLELAFADPLDACAPAEVVAEEDQEQEVFEERDATPEEAEAAAAAAAANATADATNANSTVAAASIAAASGDALAENASRSPLRINATKRVTVRVNVTKRTAHYTAVAGKYAIVYRGGCPMIDKARHIEAAGAAGLIIVNSGADPASPPALIDLQEEASRRWRCRFGGMCAEPPTLDPSAADGNGIVPAPASLQAAGGVPGATQAIADDAVKEKPVRLAVMMISALAAARWRWVDPATGGAVRTIADLGVRLQLRPRSARGDQWDTLAEDLPAMFAVAAGPGARPGAGAPPAAPATGGAPGAARGAAAVAAARRAAAATPGAALSLPADHGSRQQLLLRLLFRHHPESEQGHPERWALVQHAVRLADKALGRGSLVAADEATDADATGAVAAPTGEPASSVSSSASAGGWTFEEELEELEGASEWREGVDPSGPKFLGRERSSATPVETASPTAAFLTAHVPLSRLDRGLYDGGSAINSDAGMGALLACGADEGSSFLLRHARLDLKSTSRVLVRRIADLLQQQACLEKWLITSGARLGTYLALFRREASDDEWARMGAALLRPFGVPAARARSTFAAYIELAAQYELRPRPGDALPQPPSASSASSGSSADFEAAAAAEAGDAAAAEAADAVDADTATVADWVAGRVRGGHSRVKSASRRRQVKRRGGRGKRSGAGVGTASGAQPPRGA